MASGLVAASSQRVAPPVPSRRERSARAGQLPAARAVPSKEDVATDLIQAHFQVEPHLTEVWRIRGENEGSPTEPIKLLEVNDATVATGSIMPFSFAPTADVPYPTIIVEVTPEEFEAVKSDPTKLPRGWSLNRERAQRFTRSA